jgi:hypothetical protein
MRGLPDPMRILKQRKEPARYLSSRVTHQVIPWQGCSPAEPKSFALWPVSQAAQSYFTKDSWPDNIPVPQAWLEFDVDSVEEATAHLESRGYRMLIKNKKEPWGQTVSRFIAPEGLLVGMTFTPWMREKK